MSKQPTDWREVAFVFGAILLAALVLGTVMSEIYDLKNRVTTLESATE